VAAAIVFGGGKSTEHAQAATGSPGEPNVSIISPRNGEVQANHAVVVKVGIENFQLAPASFGEEPELGEGNLRFSLNRVPNCVDPKKLEEALNSPLGKERLKGKSMDFPKYARPEIFYHSMPPGFYRLVVSLAQNNGAALTYHAVTNFQILQRPGHHQKKCEAGKVSSAKAAAALE
jgi:hypothetical protein